MMGWWLSHHASVLGAETLHNSERLFSQGFIGESKYVLILFLLFSKRALYAEWYCDIWQIDPCISWTFFLSLFCRELLWQLGKNFFDCQSDWTEKSIFFNLCQFQTKVPVDSVVFFLTTISNYYNPLWSKHAGTMTSVFIFTFSFTCKKW